MRISSQMRDYTFYINNKLLQLTSEEKDTAFFKHFIKLNDEAYQLMLKSFAPEEVCKASNTLSKLYYVLKVELDIIHDHDNPQRVAAGRIQHKIITRDAIKEETYENLRKRLGQSPEFIDILKQLNAGIEHLGETLHKFMEFTLGTKATIKEPWKAEAQFIGKGEFPIHDIAPRDHANYRTFSTNPPYPKSEPSNIEPTKPLNGEFEEINDIGDALDDLDLRFPTPDTDEWEKNLKKSSDKEDK